MVEKLGKLEVYDVEQPKEAPAPSIETYDIEQPKKYSKWDKVKGYVAEKVQTYRAERKVIKAAKREARIQERHERAGERYQERIDRAREPRRPFQGIQVNRPAMLQGRNKLVAMSGKTQSFNFFSGLNNKSNNKRSSSTDFGLGNLGKSVLAGSQNKKKGKQKGGIAGFRIGF